MVEIICEWLKNRLDHVRVGGGEGLRTRFDTYDQNRVR
jgi:hypothetical protein